MRIAVLGTSAVGRAIAGRTAEVGHAVTMGTRDPAATCARDEFAAWYAGHSNIPLSTFADAAKDADCAVICTDHKVFDYASMPARFPSVVDTRNALKGLRAQNIFRL